jgi:hypothetical protein
MIFHFLLKKGDGKNFCHNQKETRRTTGAMKRRQEESQPQPKGDEKNHSHNRKEDEKNHSHNRKETRRTTATTPARLTPIV